MSRDVKTYDVTLAVIGVAPEVRSQTKFAPFVRLAANEGPFQFTAHMTPVEAMQLAEALSAEAIRVSQETEGEK